MSHRLSSSSGRARRSSRAQRPREHRPASRRIRGFDGAVVFFHDRLADAEAESGSPSWPLGGVERIENAGQRVIWNSGAVVLKAGPNRIPCIPQADAQRAALASLADGLL